ncbi:hypothetical protein T10_7142 [Trichinella papuae]|uniref:Uncharacterized protein n=1 Tax=Trichinella papuae TaxID=268474 RepID=A0A0V1M9I6_9BILA|nr:hypothetical protein T10_7142 [Trichinella papuae]
MDYTYLHLNVIAHQSLQTKLSLILEISGKVAQSNIFLRKNLCYTCSLRELVLSSFYEENS